jgi:hypothetical protein
LIIRFSRSLNDKAKGDYVSQSDILSAGCVSLDEGSNVTIGGTVVNGKRAISYQQSAFSFQQKPNQGH